MRRTAILLSTLIILLFSVFVTAQSGVRALVINEFANVRIVPAIGAEVIGTVPAGYVFEAVTGRSGDGEWIRVSFNGSEGWVNLAPLKILEGDLNSLPVADPRTIPYGGFDAPRSGPSSATSDNKVRIEYNLILRAGPGQGYPMLANVWNGSEVPVFGRTPDSYWIQINYEGTLGWVASAFVVPLNGLSINSLPIDGIVADSPPIIDDSSNGYFDTLRLMLARLDLAQPSLDNIRGKWTDASLTGRAFCRDYPARPSDLNIASDLLAAFYPQLFPLQSKFNDAMYNLRLAIDLFIEVCNQPGTGNPVSQATVIGALNAVNLADRQFAELRAEIAPLLPPDREPGPDECLLVFRDRAAILSVIQIGQIVRVPITVKDRSAGFCFDALPEQNLTIQVIRIDGDIEPLVAVSPFDNPTNFLGIGSLGVGQELLYLQNVIIPFGGRYLFLLNDPGGDEGFLEGEIAFVIFNTPDSGLVPQLVYDPENDSVNFLTTGTGTGTGTAAGCPNLSFVCGQLTCAEAQACYNAGNTALDQDGDGQPCDFICGTAGTAPGNTVTGNNGTTTCPSTSFTCDQLFSCQEATACLAAGNFSLDPDGNGIPCEPSLCTR